MQTESEQSGREPDPWAEAEAAVGKRDSELEGEPEESSDPWAEAAVGGEEPGDGAAQEEAQDQGEDPWAAAEAAVSADSGQEQDAHGHDPWAEAEAAVESEASPEESGAAAPAEEAGSAKAWAEAVKAAAAAKQGGGEAPSSEAEAAHEVEDHPAGEVGQGAGSEQDAGSEQGVGEESDLESEDGPESGDAGEVEEEPSQTVEAAELVPFGEDEGLDARVRSIAALLFASPEPLGASRLVELLDDVDLAGVRDGVGQLQARMQAGGLPFECRAVAGGWRLFTEPALGEVVARLAKQRKVERLSQAGLETLAIIAYRQPVTKAEIEAIRGVQAGPMLRTLADRGLVRVAGRADQPGSPLLYATTRDFLDRFGLASLKDLPRDAELARD
jgi:segregation and condensation protein B